MTARSSSTPFDLLGLHGEDWRPRPLGERKARLTKIFVEGANVHDTRAP
jgi:ATP-dependent DNA ligase